MPEKYRTENLYLSGGDKNEDKQTTADELIQVDVDQRADEDLYNKFQDREGTVGHEGGAEFEDTKRAKYIGNLEKKKKFKDLVEKGGNVHLDD